MNPAPQRPMPSFKSSNHKQINKRKKDLLNQAIHKESFPLVSWINISMGGASKGNPARCGKRLKFTSGFYVLWLRGFSY